MAKPPKDSTGPHTTGKRDVPQPRSVVDDSRASRNIPGTGGTERNESTSGRRIENVSVNRRILESNPDLYWEDGVQYEHPTVEEYYTREQEKRTTRTQLQSQIGDKQSKKSEAELKKIYGENWQDERMLRTNVRRAQTKRRVAHIKSGSRFGSKEALAKKLVAKAAFRAVLWATYFVAPVIFGFWVLLGVAYFSADDTFQEGVGEVTDAVLEFDFGAIVIAIADLATKIPVTIPGVIQELAHTFDVTASFAIAFYAAAAGIGVVFTLVIFLMYKLSPIPLHPFGGKNGGGKMMRLIAGIILQTNPLTCGFPWFLWWAYYVSKHPE